MSPLLVALWAALLVAIPRVEAPRADTTILIQGFGFKPKRLEVPLGTRVRWDNRDEIGHTVTATSDSGAAPLFDGVMEGKGQSFGFTFDRAGTFVYTCARHSFMRGEIRVIAKGDQ